MAGSSIYEIIKNERIIMAAVSTFKPAEIENTFNKCVQNAINNYNAFCTNVQLNPNELEIDLLTNFNELFELVIDIKKMDTEKSGADAVAAVVAVAAIENEVQHSKAKRARN